MKWLKIVSVGLMIGVILPLVITPPVPAMAATTADVVITFTPGIFPGAITGFTVVDLGAITVTGNWTSPVSATHVMIRAAKDTYPPTVSDGELMYYGENTTCNWTGFSLETTTYYFSAWSYNETSGLYSSSFVTASIGGEGMELIGESVGLLSSAFQNFFILIVGLISLIFFSVMAFWRENSIMFMLAAGVSILVGFNCYDVESSSWMFGVALILWAYSIVCLIFGFMCIFKRRPAD